MANGFFREDQSHRLGALLDAAGKRGLFRVIMIHHPPVRNAVPQHKRLFGIGNFQNIVGRHGAELVLHGHSHLASLHFIDGKQAKCRWWASPQPDKRRAAPNPAAQYNMFDIDGEPGHWSVRLARRGLTGAADAACGDRGCPALFRRRDREAVRS